MNCSVHQSSMTCGWEREYFQILRRSSFGKFGKFVKDILRLLEVELESERERNRDVGESSAEVGFEDMAFFLLRFDWLELSPRYNHIIMEVQPIMFVIAPVRVRHARP